MATAPSTILRCWKRHLAFEELEGVHLDWKELERLWDAEHYRFDPVGRRFIPVKE